MSVVLVYKAICYNSVPVFSYTLTPLEHYKAHQ